MSSLKEKNLIYFYYRLWMNSQSIKAEVIMCIWFYVISWILTLQFHSTLLKSKNRSVHSNINDLGMCKWTFLTISVNLNISENSESTIMLNVHWRNITNRLKLEVNITDLEIIGFTEYELLWDFELFTNL